MADRGDALTLPDPVFAVQSVDRAGSRIPAFDEESYADGNNDGFDAGYMVGIMESSMLEVDQGVARTVSTRIIAAGSPLVITGDLLIQTVVSLKKIGGAFSVIAPVLTARDTFIDVDLTGVHLDTLGLCQVVVAVPGATPAVISMNVTTNKASIDTILSASATLLTTTDNLRKAAFGRWKIENNQLTIYDDDGTTPLEVFNLKDSAGDPSMESVFERAPVP